LRYDPTYNYIPADFSQFLIATGNMNKNSTEAELNKQRSSDNDITLGVAVRKMPWLTPLAVFLWYGLYGWGLAALNSPAIDWIGAYGVAAALAAAIHTALLLAVPLALIASWVVASPLFLDSLIVTGNDRLQKLANLFVDGIALFAFSLVLAALWFAVIFWFKRQMERTALSKRQSFGILTGISYLGLGLGWLIDQII
jgi:hypothetical protein